MTTDRAVVLCRAMRFNAFYGRGFMSKSYKIGRDAKTGRFITVKEAERRKTTAIVETIKKK